MTATKPYTVTLSHDNSRSEIIFPHFSYPAYSGAGLPNPWYITRCFEAGRMLAFNHGFIHGDRLVREGGMFVVMKADYVFHWDLISSARRRTYFPYKVVVTLKRVGKTSFVWHHDMINLLDNKTLASLDAVMVHLKRKTRRTMLLPKWFFDKYGTYQNDVEIPRVILPEVPPFPVSFSHSVTIMPSSIDYNAHLNNSEVVRLALDCVAVASRKNHFIFIKGDVRAMWLTDLEVYYRREGLEGDVFNVFTWEGEKPGEVYCVIKQDEEVSSYHKMKFDLKQSHL